MGDAHRGVAVFGPSLKAIQARLRWSLGSDWSISPIRSVHEQVPLRRSRSSNQKAPVNVDPYTGPVDECFYEKVIKVKADVAALLNLISDIGAIVGW
jgi:hypothetical protein